LGMLADLALPFGMDTGGAFWSASGFAHLEITLPQNGRFVKKKFQN
jgi:hypothetical protein